MSLLKQMQQKNGRARDRLTIRPIPFLASRWNWDTEMRGVKEGRKFYFSLSKIQPGAGDEGLAYGRSAHLVAERFLEIKNGEQALKFFQEFGPMQIAHQAGSETQKPTADPVSLSQVKALQELFSTGISETATPKEHRKRLNNWYLTHDPLKIEIHYSPVPIGTVPCKDVQECLRTNVFLDSLRKIAWPECAKCGKKFRRYNEKMIYCSKKCARGQAQIAYLKRFAIKSVRLEKKGRHESVSEPVGKS